MITPNMLTSVRIGLVPLWIFSYLYIPKNGEKIAFFILFLSALTDVLDGYMARKKKMITKLGTVLDPLADKIMLVSVLTVFAVNNKISLWILIIVVLKEILMVIGAYLVYNYDGIVVPANIYGKVSTFWFYLSGFALMLEMTMGEIFINVFVVLNILSLIVYLYNYVSVKGII